MTTITMTMITDDDDDDDDGEDDDGDDDDLLMIKDPENDISNNKKNYASTVKDAVALLTNEMLCFRSYGHHQTPRNATENYPQAFIEQLHIGDINSRSMFSPSFVDHMRIPRAMEVKIVESVNSLNKPNQHPAAYACSPPCSSPILENDYLNTDVFANHKERMPPSREQSFRYQTMTTEESKERIYRERLLVSELREKLRNQRKIDE